MLAGCASIPPGSDFPKTASTAFAHPEQTQLGQRFEAAARQHGGDSGFHLLSVAVSDLVSDDEVVFEPSMPDYPINRRTRAMS